jgi:hypothetical protein
MKYTSALLAAVAAGAVIAPIAAHAATPAKHHHARHHDEAQSPRSDEDSMLLKEEVSQLRAEVNSLHQEISAEKQTATATQSQLADTQSQIGEMHAQVPAAAKAAADTEIAVAIDKEHHSDRSYYRGITIKPVGFLEAAGIFRQHFQGSDIGSSFTGVPFPNAGGAYPATEQRFSARQSRLGFLAEGKVNKDTTLGMYGEFDFLGAAQTANSNESNSYNPRIRHLYATVDWNKGDSGWHLLAGQNWSLATMNTKGITPRNELTPPQIDAQYVPGFVWARQAQFRLTGDFLDHHLWIAVSAENSQTEKAQGSIPSNIVGNAAGGLVAPGSSFNSANNLSINGTPDLIGKVAYEGNVEGHSLHLEGFAISRTFTAVTTAGANENKAGYGFGGGVVLQAIPDLLDLQFSGITGKGIGRYGTSGLADITFDSNGGIHPVKEFALLAGATAHVTKMLDVYGFAGEEVESNSGLTNGELGTYTNGFSAGNNSGCFTYGTGTCNSANRAIRQITAGFWQKIYKGGFGHAQVGIQYSYTQRELFADANGIAPKVGENMAFLSFRYYPFN